jgi:septin family protein
VLNTLRWRGERSMTRDTVSPDDEKVCDFVAAREMAMASSLSRIRHDGAESCLDIFRPASAALEENKMKAKKSEHIIVEELEGLLDDEDLIDDDYLASILQRRMHPPNGAAMRREQSPRRYRLVLVRRRRRL